MSYSRRSTRAEEGDTSNEPNRDKSTDVGSRCRKVNTWGVLGLGFGEPGQGVEEPRREGVTDREMAHERRRPKERRRNEGDPGTDQSGEGEGSKIWRNGEETKETQGRRRHPQPGEMCNDKGDSGNKPSGKEKTPPAGQNAVLGTSFPTPGAPFLPKMSYFQSGAQF